MSKSVEPLAVAPSSRARTGNVWRIFVSYRRSELTLSIAYWLKEQLEREKIVSTTGETFTLDIFVDAAEPHRPDFQANLVPRLQHSRALIVLADEGAASRRESPAEDYLYQELDWWAKERRSTPPIILQLDKSGLNLAADPALVRWRKVNFLPCLWESWTSRATGGEAEKGRLLSQVKESIRTYGEIVHIKEVRRLRVRAYIAIAFALAALVGAFLSYRQSKESQRQRERAEAQTVVAKSESNAAAIDAANFAAISGDPQTARNWLDGIEPKQRGWEWFYLRGMTDTARSTLTQTDEYLGSRIGWKTFDDRSFKEDKLTIVAFSPDGNVVVAGSEDGELLLWDPTSGKRLYKATVSRGVKSIAVDPDGQSVAVGSLDGSLSILDLKTKTLSRLSDEDGVVSVLLYIASARLLSAAWDGSITIWNTETHSKINRYSSPDAVAELRKLADDEAAEDKKYGFARRSSFDPRHVIKLTKGDPSVEQRLMGGLRPIAASFLNGASTGDGHTFWAETGDGTIVRIDLDTWRSDPVAKAASSSELNMFSGARPLIVERELVKAGVNHFTGRILRIWEPARPSRKIDARKLGADAKVLGLSPNGKLLAVAVENRVDVYRFDDLVLEQSLAGHDLPVNSAVFLDESRLVTASDDGHVKIWDLHYSRLVPFIRAHSSAVTAVAFRTFGGEQVIITASSDGTVKSFPLRSPDSPSVLFREEQRISSTSLNEDAKLPVWFRPKRGIWSLSLSEDERKLALIGEGEDVAVVDLVAATQPARILKITNAQALTFAGSGDRLLVSVDWRKENVSFRLVDIATGNILVNDRGDESGELFGGDVLDVRAVTAFPHQDKFAWASDSLMGVGDGGFCTLQPPPL